MASHLDYLTDAGSDRNDVRPKQPRSHGSDFHVAYNVRNHRESNDHGPCENNSANNHPYMHGSHLTRLHIRASELPRLYMESLTSRRLITECNYWSFNALSVFGGIAPRRRLNLSAGFKPAQRRVVPPPLRNFILLR